MGQASNTIATAAGVRITPPRAQIPSKPTPPASAFPFSEVLAERIKDRWEHGGNFVQLADALLDVVAHHIRTSPMAKLDARLADAIEDGMRVDPLEGDLDQAGECSVEDIEAHNARRHARLSIGLAPQSYTAAECEGMVGAMLKRPAETKRYETLRQEGHTVASALAVVLHERKEREARNAHNWDGGKL